jgi:hypothetical protein
VWYSSHRQRILRLTPATTSMTGYIPGVDGHLLRSQIQLFF